MPRLAYYSNILILLLLLLLLSFVCCEPSNSRRNPFNEHKNDPVSFNASNENDIRGLKELTARIFFNVTASSTKAPPPLRPISRSFPSRNIPSSSSLVRRNFEENITTNYYTTHVDNYPDFSAIAPKLRKFQSFLAQDTLPPPDLDPHSLIEQDAYKYRHLCRTEIELITPREMVIKGNKKVKIVNYPDMFEQIIRAETCGQKDSPCTFSDNFPNNYVPICKQNYIFRKLVTMSDSNDPEVTLEDVPIPSCCECVLKDMTMD